MPRKLRVEYPGALYHLMSRGDRREDIFLDDVDRQDFIKTLAEACQKTDWQMHKAAQVDAESSRRGFSARRCWHMNQSSPFYGLTPQKETPRRRFKNHRNRSSRRKVLACCSVVLVAARPAATDALDRCKPLSAASGRDGTIRPEGTNDASAQ